MENEKNMAMPEFTNEEVEKAIKQFLDEKSNENMANLMQAMRDTRFLVPADFPPDIKKQVIEKAKRGEKIDVKTAPRMLPIIVQNPQGTFCTSIHIFQTDGRKRKISGNSECDDR